MEQNIEAAQQRQFDNPGMSTPESSKVEAPMNLPGEIPEIIEQNGDGDTVHEIMDKAQQLGRSTIDAGTRAFHAVQDRVQTLQDKDMSPEKAKKVRMVASASAGTIALASTIGVAVKKRGNSRPAPKMQQTSRHLMERAKEIIPSR